MTDVAAAKEANNEIECHNGRKWVLWPGRFWNAGVKYRGRPRQPKKRVVKMLCWFDGEDLFWKPDGHPVMHWQRFPAGDIEGEVEE